jgi:6-phosphogluconolactonase
MTPEPVITVESNAQALASRVARLIAARIASTEGSISLCLSGGTTPERTYEFLAQFLREPRHWQKVHLFWGDERFVPADHQDSNFRMARRALIDHVPIPAAQVHPIPTACGSPEMAALLYEAALREFYGSAALEPQRPLFDLTLLGLGEDGHIASLFPGTRALNERHAWAAPVIGAKPEPRISLTFPAIEASQEILFIVSGTAKRDILARVLAGDEELPATRLATSGVIHIFADKAAAGA